MEASLKYDLPFDMFVLPCSWFDADWIENPYKIGCDKFFEKSDKQYDFDNFFKGSFCYHWHNRWNNQIDETSICYQLVKYIQQKL
jgi:hypothetical protein